jgi:glycosyltransferase involved in cell wall biosynthesis
MKVLHVETGKNLFGGALQVLYLLRGLKERGVSNILVCTRGSALADQARGLADQVHPLPMAGDLDLRFIWRLRRIIVSAAPDIVHLHSRRGADVLGGLAAAFTGSRTILSRRVDNPEPRPLVHLKYRLYDRVITISEGIRKVLVEEGLDPSRIRCVPSAVDLEKYRPGCEGEWFRREFSLGEENRTVGMAAQFIKRKGHEYLLEAVPRVLQSFPAARFLLFGKGPLEAVMKGVCRTLRIEHAVLFPGFRTDLHRILPCLDVVAHPAQMEGLGVSLLQAAASGVPIIATRVGGIPEIIRDGMNGRLVEPGSSRPLAEALVRLLGSAETRRAMGAAGRRIAEEEFSTAAMVEGNLRVYGELLQGA